MNSAKTLLIVAVLVAIATGSYFVFNRPEPPPPLTDVLTKQPETNLGNVNDQNSSSTDDFGQNATRGGPPPLWNADAGDQGFAPFNTKNRSFEKQDPGDRRTIGSRTDPVDHRPTSAGRHDTIPDSNRSGDKFGSQGAVTLPRSDGFQTGFDTRDRFDRARVEAPNYRAAMARAQNLMDQSRLAEALGILSPFYEHPTLSAAENRELTTRLDQLAGTVVYSSESFIEGPYEVQRGESLKDIADAYQVPWELLAKINRIDDPNRLLPGQKLKVIKGPFSATINLAKRQLTLWVGGDYAGRFPLVEVKGTAPEKDTFVRTKNRTGDRFIELANNVRICGPRHVASTTGCTAVLSQEDVDDLFDILKVQSDVLFRR